MLCDFQGPTTTAHGNTMTTWDAACTALETQTNLTRDMFEGEASFMGGDLKVGDVVLETPRETRHHMFLLRLPDGIPIGSGGHPFELVDLQRAHFWSRRSEMCDVIKYAKGANRYAGLARVQSLIMKVQRDYGGGSKASTATAGDSMGGHGKVQEEEDDDDFEYEDIEG